MLLYWWFHWMSCHNLIQVTEQASSFSPLLFQVKEIFDLGFYSLLLVPPVLAIMNLFWFWKIAKGLVKTVSKKRHKQWSDHCIVHVDHLLSVSRRILRFLVNIMLHTTMNITLSFSFYWWDRVRRSSWTSFRLTEGPFLYYYLQVIGWLYCAGGSYVSSFDIWSLLLEVGPLH